MECISLDVKNNWALKLGNLRRLKKALDKYLEEELKISNSKFDRIDLPNLARKAQPEEIIKLFESIFYAIVNCPQKGVFIKRIMELEEPVQVQLMFFIQKIIGEDEDNPIQDSELFKKELDMLKNEKRKLTKQVTELEQELASTVEEKNRVNANFQQIKAENERLYADIDKKSVKEERHSTAIIFELRTRLNEKDESINELQKSIDKIKKQYEIEIAQLKDDLDISTAKVYQNMNADKTLQQYKKRLESLAGVKQKAADLQKQNENLIETINSQHLEIDSLSKFKKQAALLKEQMAKEKNRADTLSFNLENKEKMIKKYEKEVSDSRQKIQLLQSKIEENNLERQDSSHASEDSFVMQLERIEVVGSPRNASSKVRGSCISTAQEQLETILKDLNYQKTLVNSKKIEAKSLRESLQMSLEEMHGRCYDYESKIKQLESNNIILSDQIQIMSENVAEKEHDKIVQEQTMYELEEVKATKVTLLNDIKTLYADKDIINKKLIDGREEFFLLQKQLGGKEMRIRELELEMTLFKEKILAFEEKEKVYNQELTSMRRNSSTVTNSTQEYMTLERELIAIKNENNELQLRLNDKNNQIAEIMSEKVQVGKQFERQIEEINEKYREELDIKTREVMAQSEEAMNALFNQREQLAAKLQFERRNTMIGWQRAMSIRDPNMFVSEEIFKLRELLLEKEKEIARVAKNNKELKVCWKDSANLLKAVWRQLGDETKKIEEALKKRNY